MSDPLSGNRYIVPYLRLFPIWRRGMRLSLIDGYVEDPDGWYPDKYEFREIGHQ